MDFAKLYSTDVSKHIEKKGQFSYLSWPYAVSEFRKACPEGIWHVETYGENNQPYCITDSGCFVAVGVWPDVAVKEQYFTQYHPVLDYKNKTVKTPDAFQVNTSIQRCLVKAIALATGIGLHIYAGEDLPDAPGQLPPVDEKPSKANIDGNTRGWLDLCVAAAKTSTKEEFRGWFNTMKADIVKDIGKDGEAIVWAKFVELGKNL